MNREFDIVIFGVTGFSGKLIAEYLVINAELKNHDPADFLKFYDIPER